MLLIVRITLRLGRGLDSQVVNNDWHLTTWLSPLWAWFRNQFMAKYKINYETVCSVITSAIGGCYKYSCVLDTSELRIHFLIHNVYPGCVHTSFNPPLTDLIPGTGTSHFCEGGDVNNLDPVLVQ